MTIDVVEHFAASPEWVDELVIRSSDGRIDWEAAQVVIPRSDLESARAIADHYTGAISYGTQTKEWRLWDGQTHRLSAAGEIDRVGHAWADVIARALALVKTDVQIDARAAQTSSAAAQIMEDDYEKRWAPWRTYRDRLFSNAGQVAVVSQLKIVCAVDEGTFDDEPDFLVVRNGVIDLKLAAQTGEIRLLPHDSSRRVTVCTDVPYYEKAKCPAWEWYLKRSLPDPDAREFLQKWSGATLLGRPKDKGLVNLIGPQDSGKSVYIEMSLAVAGGYGKPVRAAAFLEKRNESPYEMHELKGVRLAGTVEPGAGKKLDEEVIKTLTGEDGVRSREPYGKFVSWKPQCTIFIASNNPLRLDTSDAALLNRIKPIRFGQSFSRDQSAPEEIRADLDLKNKLKRELPGILKWFLDGLSAYQRDGLGEEPASVTTVREELAEMIDNPLAWAVEMIEAGHLREATNGEPTSHGITVGDAFLSYQMWCGANGEYAYSKTRFAGVIKRRYGDTVKSMGARFPRLVNVRTESTEL